MTADELTTEFPMLDITEAQKEIISSFIAKTVSQLSVPSLSGGQPDVLLGIKYQSVHPQIVHEWLLVSAMVLKSSESLELLLFLFPSRQLKIMILILLVTD